jgi:hypothetical protein
MTNRQLGVLYNTATIVIGVALLSPFVSAVVVTVWRTVWGK